MPSGTMSTRPAAQARSSRAVSPRAPARPSSGALRRAAPLAAVLALGILAYSNALHGRFVFDDVNEIVGNPRIRLLADYLPFARGYQAFPNRYVGYASFALNHALGGYDVVGYHLLNVAIHLLNALLVYALVVLTFRAPRLAASRLAPHARAVALAAALLFVAHPLQTQAVTYVVQRFTSLATTFYLLGVVLYARWRLAPAASAARRAGGYALVLAAALLAMRTKEIAFTLPIAIGLYELAFLDGPVRQRLLFLAPILLTMAVIPATLVHVGVGKPAGDVIARASAVANVHSTLSRLDYLRTEAAVVVTYLRLLVLPVGQNLDHDYPTYHSFLEPRVLGSLAVILSLAALAVWLFVRSRLGGRSEPLDPAVRLVAFGIAWFFLALSVESSLIPIVDVIYEHRVYLPSVGFFAAVATAAALLLERRFIRRVPSALVGGAAVIAVVLAAATFARNEVWASELTLWSDAASKSPAKPRPLNNLGAALADDGRPDEAIALLTRALRIDPEHAESYYNLGRVYLNAYGRSEEAEALFRKAIALHADYRDAYVNLGGALVRQRRYREAVEVLERAGPMVKDSAEAHFNLGVAYHLLGDADAARRELGTLAELSPRLAAQLERYLNGG
jgi:tetratricopeptide (TPR) repeat protein